MKPVEARKEGKRGRGGQGAGSKPDWSGDVLAGVKLSGDA